MKLQVLDLNSQTHPVSNEFPSWKSAFSSAIRNIEELLKYVEVSPEQLNILDSEVLAHFPVRVPISYANKIRKGDIQDPLLLQVLPSKDEAITLPGYVKDPLDEIGSNPVPGIIHKYQNRVLFVATQACVIHCRYCFRRYFPYTENAISSRQFEQALAYIAEHQELDEVILSGGDPLSLSDEKLAHYLYSFAKLDHIKRIRIHSRLLAVMPERVTEQLLVLFKSLGKELVVVVHINHNNEIDEQLKVAMGLIRETGVHLLNQTVLMAKVNDDSAALTHLNLKLFEAGILPYYLHVLDPVAGTHHFHVPMDKAIVIMNELQARLPGYLIPKLVKEEAHKPSKTLIHY